MACTHCEKPPGPEGHSSCRGCRMVVYCSRECQKAAWPEHKRICKSSEEKKAEDIAARRMVHAKGGRGMRSPSLATRVCSQRNKRMNDAREQLNAMQFDRFERAEVDEEQCPRYKRCSRIADENAKKRSQAMGAYKSAEGWIESAEDLIKAHDHPDLDFWDFLTEAAAGGSPRLELKLESPERCSADNYMKCFVAVKEQQCVFVGKHSADHYSAIAATYKSCEAASRQEESEITQMAACSDMLAIVYFEFAVLMMRMRVTTDTLSALLVGHLELYSRAMEEIEKLQTVLKRIKGSPEAWRPFMDSTNEFLSNMLRRYSKWAAEEDGDRMAHRTLKSY